MHTYDWWINHPLASKHNAVNMRLARSILLCESIPSDCLSVQPMQLYEKLTQLDVEEIKGTSK